MRNFKIKKDINKSYCGQCRQFRWPGGGREVRRSSTKLFIHRI